MSLLLLPTTSLVLLLWCVIASLTSLSQGCEFLSFVSLAAANETVVTKSPYFPGNYPPYLNCGFRYEVAPNRKVRIQFTSFSLEGPNAYGICSFDYVQLFDGVDDYALQFGTFCEEDVPSTIVSTGSNLYLLFHTDSSIQAHGFRAVISSVSDQYREPLPTAAPGSCTSILRESADAFYSPGYPSSYDVDQFCTFIISLPDSSDHILLRFTSFDIEPSYQCVYDYIEIRDGPSELSPMIGRYCGGANNKPPRLIESAGPELHVVFHSDVSATFEGFYAEYASSTTGFPTRAPQAVDELGEPVENYISVCDFTQALQTERGGTIVSHKSYPEESYTAGRICSMVFVASLLNEKVFINVLEMDLPSGRSCSTGDGGDFLKIVDGDLSRTDGSRSNLATLCGTSTGQYTSSFLYAVLQFTTDENTNQNHKGFKLVYSIYYEDSYGCANEDFYCANRRCIDPSLVCDGYDHCGDNTDETKGCSGEEGGEWWVIVLIIVIGLMVLSLGACLATTVMKNKIPPPRNNNLDTDALTTISGRTATQNSSSLVAPPPSFGNPTYQTSGSFSDLGINPELQPPSYSQIFSDPAYPPPNGQPDAPQEKSLYPRQEYTMNLTAGLGVGPSVPSDVGGGYAEVGGPGSGSPGRNNALPPISGKSQSSPRGKKDNDGGTTVQLPSLMAPGARIQRNNTLPSLPSLRGNSNANSNP